MRRLDETPIDPEVAAVLDAIDATLAGEAVGPEHADVAELALLVRAERPAVAAEFSRSLDERVARRFAAPAPSRSRSRAGARAGAGARSRRAWLVPSLGLGSAAVAALIVVVVLSSGHHASSSGRETTVASATANTRAGNAATAAVPAATASGQGASASSIPSVPAPTPTSRKAIQSAQLDLSAPPVHIDDVAQEVFDTIGREGGYVDNSTVTATGRPDGYARFQLTVPSSALASTMSSLSALRYATVASRTDTTQDVTDQFSATTRALADARALRTSLLKQLANASTQQQIDSLQTQINDADASISSDEATLSRLNHQVNYTQISLMINANALPVPVNKGGSFTIGKAAHDAGRVLTVAAGVALIALAAAVPLSLVAALWWWIATTLRRRRREQALDAA